LLKIISTLFPWLHYQMFHQAFITWSSLKRWVMSWLGCNFWTEQFFKKRIGVVNGINKPGVMVILGAKRFSRCRLRSSMHANVGDMAAAVTLASHNSNDAGNTYGLYGHINAFGRR